MSDEEKIQIAALGLLGLFNRKPKSKPETKEDPGVLTQPDSSDSEDSDGDKLSDRPGRSPPRGSGGRPRGSGGRRETKEQEETPQQKLDKIKSNRDNDMILIAIGTLFDEIDRKNNGGIILRDLIVAIRDNKRVQRIFGLDSIREGGNSNPVKNLFDKIDSIEVNDLLSKDELILFLFRKENIQMLNMLKGTTEAIVIAHRQYDVNQDGFVDLIEYTRGFEQQGETIEDARENLLLTDIDRNGQLDIYEFARAVYGSSSVAPWYNDMINTNFERAQRGELRADNMSRPYGPRTPPVDRVPVVDPRTPMTDPTTPIPQRRPQGGPRGPEGPYRPIGPYTPPRGRRIPNIDMQPGRTFDDPTPSPPQRKTIEPPYDGSEQPPGPLAPYGPDKKKKKKRKKKKAGEKGEHHATKAKARAKQILKDAGVMIENSDGTVEYKIDQTNVSAWERVIKDIKALDKKQASSVLYQAVLKGMYKDTRTSKSSNISLKDLKSGKVLKPGGFEKYIGDYLTDPNQRGLQQVDQYKAAEIATRILDDLKKGINLFNEYKPRGRGKAKPKTKPSDGGSVTKILNDFLSSSSDESNDDPIPAPQNTPEVVVRSMSPTPGFDPGVQDLLDSLDDQSDDQKLEELSGRLKKDLYEYGSSSLATNLRTMLNSITTMKEFNTIVRSGKDKTIIRKFRVPDSTNNKELPGILGLKTDAEIAEEFRVSTRKRVKMLYMAQISAGNINNGTIAKFSLKRREIATLSSKYADAEQLSLAFPAGDVTLIKMAILQKIKEGYRDEEVVDPMFENSLQPRLRF